MAKTEEPTEDVVEETEEAPDEAEDEEPTEDVVEETPPEMLTVEILEDCTYQIGRADAEIENVELVQGSVLELPVELALYFAGAGKAELSEKKLKKLKTVRR